MVASTDEFSGFSSSRLIVPATSPKTPVVSGTKYLTANSTLECSRSTLHSPPQPCSSPYPSLNSDTSSFGVFSPWSTQVGFPHHYLTKYPRGGAICSPTLSGYDARLPLYSFPARRTERRKII